MHLAPHTLSTVTHARDAAYDLVLLGHVLTAFVGFGAVVVAGAYALALRRSGPGSESVRRYYRPGANWAGRVLFLVPVLGASLVALGHGDWSYSDGWITAGLMLWVIVALVAEMALWPTEQKLQVAVGQMAYGDEVRAQCLQMAALAAALAVLLVVASVLMVAKP